MAENDSTSFRGAGGTSGGIGQFVLGLILLGLGLYLFLSRVIVTSNLWELFGMNAFGVALVPLVIGIALLFFDSKSIAGWVLAIGSFLVIIVGLAVQTPMTSFIGWIYILIRAGASKELRVLAEMTG